MGSLVSIIVPVYKIRPDYLRECVDSLVSQTYKNIEVLLIDDGSPDDCGVICDDYAEKYPFVQAIHQENQGVSVARNHGIECAAGEYIIFVDADDWIEADCVQTVLAEIERQKVDVLFFQRQYEAKKTVSCPVGNAHYIENTEIKTIQLAILKEKANYDGIDFKPPWGKIIRKSVLKNNAIRFPEGVKKSEDVIFNLYLYELMEGAYYLNYIGYHYRINSESINHRYNPEMSQILIRALEEAEHFVEQCHNEDVEFKKALGIRSFVLLSIIESTYTVHRDSKLSLKETSRATREYLQNSTVKKYISQCQVSDFDSVKRKIKFLMCRQESLLFYAAFCKLKKIKRCSGFGWFRFVKGERRKRIAT